MNHDGMTGTIIIMIKTLMHIQRRIKRAHFLMSSSEEMYEERRTKDKCNIECNNN